MSSRTGLSFGQSVTLLLLTAALTGLLIPLLFRYVDAVRERRTQERDDRRDREKKQLEADISRQTAIIEAQRAFLQDLTHEFFRLQHLLVDVSYYHNLDTNLFEEARGKYEREATAAFGAARAVMGRALWLAPTGVYERLKQFYFESLIKSDGRLSQLLMQRKAGNDDANAWTELNRHLVLELADEISAKIDETAAALGLKAPESR